jgi:hypothetical protein
MRLLVLGPNDLHLGVLETGRIVLMVTTIAGIYFLIMIIWRFFPTISNFLIESRPVFSPLNLTDNSSSGNWSISGYYQLSDFVPFVNSDCESCSFTVRNQDPDSSQSDAVIATMFQHSYNLVPFVRSLRTTGCKARIVFLIDNSVLIVMDSDLTSFLGRCGCTLINLGNIDLSRNSMLLLRNRVLDRFFERRAHVFERVVIVDLYDAIFQGDPFYQDFSRTTVGFSMETRPCDRGQRRCAGYLLGEAAAERFREVNCINVGTIVGIPALVQKFLVVYVNYLDAIPVKTLKRMSWIPDQVIINSMHITGELDRAGVPLRLYKTTEEYHVMFWMFNLVNISYDLGEYRALDGGTYPFLVHLWDRSKKFGQSILRRCPQTFPTIDRYIRWDPIYR